MRDYVNMFGFMQKNSNGLDILIEDAKQLLRGWGASEPNFLLLNSRLTFNLNMLPENTQYITQGPDGQRKLAQGPDVKSYRGIRIIHTRAFSIEEGSAPRDLLRRRVRVAEFYLLPNCRNANGIVGGDNNNGGDAAAGGGDQQAQLAIAGPVRAQVGAQQQQQADPVADAGGGGGALLDAHGEVRLYDESSDSFVVVPYKKLLDQCRRFIRRANDMAGRRNREDPLYDVRVPETIGSVLLLRINIEHSMLGIILGKGGSQDDLGATLWGQTELSCFDDGQHGVWVMSYKYHASAIVFNNRNLIRLWDIAYDGYCGGKDTSILDWGNEQDLSRFIRCDNNLAAPYGGPSIVVLPLPTSLHSLPSPLPIANLVNPLLSTNAHTLATADLFVEDMLGFLRRVEDKIGSEHILGLQNAISIMYDLLHLHRNSAASKCAGLATVENEATLIRLAYGGTYFYKLNNESTWAEVYGKKSPFCIMPHTCTTHTALIIIHPFARRSQVAGTIRWTRWDARASAPARASSTAPWAPSPSTSSKSSSSYHIKRRCFSSPPPCGRSRTPARAACSASADGGPSRPCEINPPRAPPRRAEEAAWHCA